MKSTTTINYGLRDTHTKICTCRGITMYTIKKAINQGACTIKQIQSQTGATLGMCKGKYCAAKIVALLKEANVLPYQMKDIKEYESNHTP